MRLLIGVSAVSEEHRKRPLSTIDFEKRRRARKRPPKLYRRDVRDLVEYWIMVFGTGTQRKGLHLPAGDSSFDEPSIRCTRPVGPDADLKSKPLDVFPPGYCPDRICVECARDLASEHGYRLGGDLRRE